MSIQLKNREAQQVASLEQLSGEGKGTLFELRKGRLTIGRASDNDLVINGEGVSRVHALLVQSEGAWFIRDNNSKNGILVNGNAVRESWLEPGDTVQLGVFLFRFGAAASDLGGEMGEGGLPQVVPVGGALEGVAIAAGGKSRRGFGGNPRLLIYLGVLGLLGGYLMLGSSEEAAKTPDPSDDGAAATEGTLAKDFKTGEKPDLKLGNPNAVPLGLEDPLLKRAEQEMARLDWSNASLREAEQFFRRGQREYLTKNFHRAIDSFQTALSLYGGHLLAERYLRRAVYEAEIEAKKNMASAIQYFESMQYTRAIHHFREVIALMAHRPTEPIVKEADRYIRQSELRLQSAELFP